MRKKHLKAFGNLIGEVIAKKVCCKCGLCIASCPVHALIMTEEGPRIVSLCRQCEACYYGCPRSSAFSRELLEASLNIKEKDDILGRYIKIVSARTLLDEVRRRAQDGGVVTSILMYALKNGMIDGALVALKDVLKPWKPVPHLALTVTDVLNAAGAKYFNCPNLVALKDALYCYSLDKVCVVGVPCQVAAARNAKVHPKAARKIGDRIAFIVGLFCVRSFSYVKLIEFLTLNKIDVAKVSKFDIREGAFKVYIDDVEVLSVPLKNLKDFVNYHCEVCTDLTSWYADISIGAIGSERGWSTVIIRSSNGERLFDLAVQDGYLEVKDIGSDGVESLRIMAKRKALKVY